MAFDGNYFVRSQQMLATLIFCLASASLANEPLPEFMPSVTALKDLSLPLGPDGSKPTLRFSCAHARIERKSVGFLRIGVLPQLVMEDVKLTILDSPDASKWAHELRLFLTANSLTSAAVIRKIEVRNGVNDGFIASSGARFEVQSQSLVLEALKLKSPDGNLFSDASGVIYLDGPNAGRLSLPRLSDKTIEINDAGFSLPKDSRQTAPTQGASAETNSH